LAAGSDETSPKHEPRGGQPAALARCGHLLTVAEDSGLVIDALDGEPGVRSARFLRPDASYSERFAEIQKRLAARPSATRTARFVCAVAVVHAGAVVYETSGVVEGEIAREARGTHGFGYDPIFYYPPYGETLGEATDEEKARVAHRGQAFRQLAQWLEKCRTENKGLSSVP
jgi:XTP/dITP diphosphohydrolase